MKYWIRYESETGIMVLVPSPPKQEEGYWEDDDEILSEQFVVAPATMNLFIAVESSGYLSLAPQPHNEIRRRCTDSLEEAQRWAEEREKEREDMDWNSAYVLKAERSVFETYICQGGAQELLACCPG